MNGAEHLPASIEQAWRVMEPIGAGPMSRVHRVRYRRHERYAALKVVALPEDRSRFLESLETAAIITHAAIVPLYDFAIEESHAYLVTELLAHDLTARARQRGSAFALSEAVAVGLSIAGALAAIEAAGRQHGGVSPTNILYRAARNPRNLTERREVLLSDVARPHRSYGPGETDVTRLASCLTWAILGGDSNLFDSDGTEKIVGDRRFHETLGNARNGRTGSAASFHRELESLAVLHHDAW